MKDNNLLVKLTLCFLLILMNLIVFRLEISASEWCGQAQECTGPYMSNGSWECEVKEGSCSTPVCPGGPCCGTGGEYCTGTVSNPAAPCCGGSAPDPTDTPTSTPTRTPTPSPTNTPTPTLPQVTGLVGTCSTFGGPISLSWQYASTNGEYFNIKRNHTSDSWVDNRTTLATTDLNPVPTLGYTDTRAVTANEIFVGPYDYQVQACYSAGVCGAYSSPATSVSCPTPPPLSTFSATCVYPFGPITTSWINSSPPAVAESNRHLAKYDGTWDRRYVSLSGSSLSYDDVHVTPALQYGYNVRRCFSEYGINEDQCKYNSQYAVQNNVRCNVQARCDDVGLQLGYGCNTATNECYRGSAIGTDPVGYNGDPGPPIPVAPYDLGTGYGVDTKRRMCDSTGNNCTNFSCSGADCNYTIPTDFTLNDIIQFKTNVQWTDTSSICSPISTWSGGATPAAATCVNNCQESLRVVCNPDEWSNWTSCYPHPDTLVNTCVRHQINECLEQSPLEVCGGLYPNPDRSGCIGPTYTPTLTPTLTNTPTVTSTGTPVPTNTPTPTRTPTVTPTATPVVATPTPTPTFTPTQIPPTPPGQPSFEGELFYDFNQNGVMNQSCVGGAIYEWMGSADFGGTGNDCTDKSALTALEALIGPLPGSLNGFRLFAEGVGGTSAVYGENPKSRLDGALRYYFFTVQNSNNYRLTVTDPNSSTRNCTITSTNPRNIYVGTSNTSDIYVGIYCNPLPPTLTPTRTPTNTPTNTPTLGATNTPTPSSTLTPTPITLTCSQCDIDADNKIETLVPTTDDYDTAIGCWGQLANVPPCDRVNFVPGGALIEIEDLSRYTAICLPTYPNGQVCVAPTLTDTPTATVTPTLTSTPAPGCNDPCTCISSDCTVNTCGNIYTNGNLRCFNTGTVFTGDDYRCRNNDCSFQSSCVCPTAPPATPAPTLPPLTCSDCDLDGDGTYEYSTQLSPFIAGDDYTFMINCDSQPASGPCSSANLYPGGWLIDNNDSQRFFTFGDSCLVTYGSTQLACSSPTLTSTPTPTNTPTHTPTPTNLPALTISGAFQQKTGSYVRSAPGLLSGNNLLVNDSVTINPFLSEDLITELSCHLPSCENLPVSDTFGSSFSGYRCSVAFPVNCSLIIPQNFGVNATSNTSIAKWYGNATTSVSIPGSSPPTSYTAPVGFTYSPSAGWMKMIGSDIIRSTNVSIDNNIPFITDRYDSNIVNPTPYDKSGTTEMKDLGHASMVDIAQTGDVGGVVAGPIDTKPADTDSQYGGSVPSYGLGADVGTNQAELSTFVQALLAAKPISYVNQMEMTADGMSTSLESNKIYAYRTDGSMLEISQIGLPSISTNILLITDANGALADVTFNNNINPTGGASLIIIARSITLAGTVTDANAIFIASDTFNTGTGTAPLKIRGNVVALNGIIQGRARGDADHARPSFLLIFDPKPYFDTMKDLSIKQLEYKVVQ